VHRIGRTGRAGASGLAITLVDRDDTRLVSDIEKLIKKKIELEPVELEDERYRRPPRRERDDDEPRGESPARGAERGEGRRADRPSERAGRPSARAAAVDPFFDRPYEPSGNGDASWEKSPAAAAPAPAPARSALSPNLRPRRKVAALLGGKA